MKFLKLGLITIFLHLVLAGSAFAGYTFLFHTTQTELENANPNTETAALVAYLSTHGTDPAPLSLIGKIEVQNDSPPDTFDFGSDINYFVVKGGEDYNFYQMAPPDSFITLDDILNDLNITNTSHITAWNYEGTTTSEVPEPATMALFGFGLLGLAGFGRNRRKKK